MIEQASVPWESRLVETAREFQYPPTPNISRAVRSRMARPRPAAARRLAWAAVLAVLLIGVLMGVPPTRAAVLEVLQIGVLRIFVAPPTDTPQPTPTARPSEPAATAPVTATRRPTATGAAPLLTLEGETTLELARQQAGFDIPLPAYPEDLGEPDRVYLQDQGGSVVILVWTVPADPQRVKLSLHLLAPDTWGVEKFEPQAVEQTTVNGTLAIWTTGPYPLVLAGGGLDFTRMIDGHVLIWVEYSVTYRLETDLTLEEAVRVAESLE